MRTLFLILAIASTILLIYVSPSVSRSRDRRVLTSYNVNLRDPKSIQAKTLSSIVTKSIPMLRSIDDNGQKESIGDQMIRAKSKENQSSKNAAIDDNDIGESKSEPIVTKGSTGVPQQTQIITTKSSVSQQKLTIKTSKKQIEIQDVSSSSGDEPSYIRLCKEVIKRQGQAEQPSTTFSVTESAAVCKSPDSYISILTIMASTMIAQGAGFWRLQYQPMCEPSGIEDVTIQQLLPKDLFLEIAAGMDAVSDMCKVCLEGTGTLACLGYPIIGINDPPVNPVVMSNRLLAFRHNIHLAVQNTRRMEIAAGLGSTTTGGAVVYLDLEFADSPSLAMPLSWYVERIPPSISSIFVIVHQQCGNCVEHGQFISNFLGDMYPRAQVHFEILGSTAVIYSRIMGAPYLLCPPTSACMLPAFFRDAAHKTFISDSPALFSWFSWTVEKGLNTFHLQIDVTKAEDVLSKPVHDMAELYPFLVAQPLPKSKTCEVLRGRLGKWEFDAEYGKKAQYVTPLRRFESFPSFVATPEVPFRPSTMYKWVDNMCPVNLITKAGFCQAMRDLKLSRIYFVGDSLQLQMAMSLWKLLGHSDEPVEKPDQKPFKQWMRYQWKRTVDCGVHRMDFQFTRNDLIDNFSDETFKFDKPGDIFNCGIAEYCMPWVKNYAEYKRGGTLLLANAGAHVHDIDSYSTVLRTFLGELDLNPKEGDMVMLRTTVPGHEKCEEQNVKPFQTHLEFESELVADFKSWHLFSDFNDHLHKTIASRNDDNPSQIKILDVYPMTVMRKDGHTSSEPMCASCRKDDCIHYALPGPLDWWNHLLYSNLVNLVALRSKKRAQ